ncbi:MAG TPA: acyltransferase [Polyangiaceae bacterium]|nr:acyltransferase [Polyangiaceae bacterium]
MSTESSASGNGNQASNTDAPPASGGWLRRTSSLFGRVVERSLEEVEALSWRKLLADACTLLPEQTFSRTRTAALRAAGAQIGKHSLVQGTVRITGSDSPCRFLSIGRQTILSGHLHLDLAAPLTIGSLVRIGHDVSLLTISHEIGEPWLRSGTSMSKPITVGDGVWIASRVTVLPGVTIGHGAVVAAGSIVTRDVAPNTLVAGVPARFVRQLEGSI